MAARTPARAIRGDTQDRRPAICPLLHAGKARGIRFALGNRAAGRRVGEHHVPRKIGCRTDAAAGVEGVISKGRRKGGA